MRSGEVALLEPRNRNDVPLLRSLRRSSASGEQPLDQHCLSQSGQAVAPPKLKPGHPAGPLAQAVLVDGSFVTDEPEPNDIDVVLVLPDGYDVSQSVSPFEYNLRSRRRIRRTFGLDLFVVLPHSLEYDRFVDFFSQVRNQPQRTKGLVRVRP